MNSIRTLRPYKFHGQWVFDDPAHDLDREAFVGGIDDIIDHVTVHLPDAASGFVMLFSDKPFPDANISLTWLREEMGGNVYSLQGTDMTGWLCSSLLEYFAEPPRYIYVCVKAAT